MLKKTITYKDYDGEERTEDFYFNLNKAELVEMQLSFSGSLTKLIEKLVNEHEHQRIWAIFKEIVLRSYGEKSVDGKRFAKSQELRDGFEQTGAYDVLMMELTTNDKAASVFINSIVPSDLQMNPDQLPLT